MNSKYCAHFMRICLVEAAWKLEDGIVFRLGGMVEKEVAVDRVDQKHFTRN